MIIEFNGNGPLFTAFHTVQPGTVFTYQGDYYIRIETVLTNSFIINVNLVNCINLSDGTAMHLDDHEQVMLVPAKLVIN